MVLVKFADYLGLLKSSDICENQKNAFLEGVLGDGLEGGVDRIVELFRYGNVGYLG